MADTPTREPTDLERRLHAALRTFAIQPDGLTYWVCAICEACWSPDNGQPEHHAPGCLAAPDALKGDEHE